MWNLHLESLREKACILKTLKNQVYMLLALLESVRIDEQVIKISNQEIVQIFLKGVVDKVLKGAGGIAKTKRHNLIFVESIIESVEEGFIIPGYISLKVAELRGISQNRTCLIKSIDFLGFRLEISGSQYIRVRESEYFWKEVNSIGTEVPLAYS